MKGAIYILIFGVIVSGFIIFLSRSNGQSSLPNADQGNNVSIVDGKQIIEIGARGGYSPRLSTAKAGIPTIVRFKTNGSFDCSSSVRIPSLNVSKLLPQTGLTDIDIGSPKTGPLLGTCSMGMYRFEIDFEA
jgi:plastocyanin domain-containing protein